MKKIVILTIVIGLALSASADHRTLKDRTDNWLQRENVETITSGSLRDGIDLGDGTDINQNTKLGAIGDFPMMLWLLVLGVGCGYRKIYIKQTRK